MERRGYAELQRIANLGAHHAIRRHDVHVAILPAPRAYKLRLLANHRIPDAGERLALLAFLRDRLESPLRIIDPDAGLQHKLDQLWRDMCRPHEVDNEVPLVDEDRFLEDILEFQYVLLDGWENLHADCFNVASWYDRILDDFSQATRNFRCDVSLASERSKHHPPSSARTTRDLARASKSGESILTFGLHADVIGMFARGLEVEYFDELVGGDSYRGAVDCLTRVGFVLGESTRYLGVEWAYPAIHVYPISEREANDISNPPALGVAGPDCTAQRQAIAITSDDTLQGFARDTREANAEQALSDLAPTVVLASGPDGRPVLTAGDLQEAAKLEKERACGVDAGLLTGSSMPDAPPLTASTWVMPLDVSLSSPANLSTTLASAG